MSYKLIVHTSRGKPDSLVNSVKIAFTLTPAGLKQHASPYSPVARWVKDFPADSQSDQVVEWGVQLAYCAYKKRVRDGREYCDDELPGNYAAVALGGQSRTLTSPPHPKKQASWTVGTPYDDFSAFRQGCVMAVNETDELQTLSLLIRDPGNSNTFSSIAAYHPISKGERCIASSELRLQAYFVKDMRIQADDILSPDDMKSPLFPVPLCCDSLPTSSIWRLSQDRNKILHLRNENEPELGFYSVEPKLNSLASSIFDIKRRLSALEASVLDAENEFADIGNELTIIQKSADQSPAMPSSPIIPSKHTTMGDHRIPILESQTAQLRRSVASTQYDLSSIHTYLQETKLEITAIETQTDGLIRAAHQT